MAKPVVGCPRVFSNLCLVPKKGSQKGTQQLYSEQASELECKSLLGGHCRKHVVLLWYEAVTRYILRGCCLILINVDSRCLGLIYGCDALHIEGVLSVQSTSRGAESLSKFRALRGCRKESDLPDIYTIDLLAGLSLVRCTAQNTPFQYHLDIRGSEVLYRLEWNVSQDQKRLAFRTCLKSDRLREVSVLGVGFGPYDEPSNLDLVMTMIPYENTPVFVYVLLKTLRQPTTGFALLGAHQNIRLTETWGLRLPDEPQKGRNRSWAAEEFSATLRKTLIIRLLKTLRHPTTGFVHLRAHQVSTVPVNLMFYLNPNWTDFDIYTSFAYRTNFDGDSPETQTLIIRLLKTLRHPTTGFVHLRAHQVSTVPVNLMFYLNPNWTDFDIYTSFAYRTNFDGDSHETQFLVLFKREGELTQWLQNEFTERKVRGSNPTSAFRFPLSRLEQPGSIPWTFITTRGHIVNADQHNPALTVSHRLMMQKGFTDDERVIQLESAVKHDNSGFYWETPDRNRFCFGFERQALSCSRHGYSIDAIRSNMFTCSDVKIQLRPPCASGVVVTRSFKPRHSQGCKQMISSNMSETPVQCFPHFDQTTRLFLFHQFDTLRKLREFYSSRGPRFTAWLHRSSKLQNEFEGFWLGDKKVQFSSIPHSLTRVQLIKSPLEQELRETYKGSRNFELTVNEVEIPKEETTYWCKTDRLPQFHTKQHIIRFEPVLSESSKGFVHHMEVFLCTGPNRVAEYNGPCNSEAKPMGLRQCRQVIAAWAVGATGLSMPKEAGIAIGGTGGIQDVVLEIHYANMHQVQGTIWLANLLIERSVVQTRPLPPDFPCLGLDNLAVSQPSYFLRVAWQLGPGKGATAERSFTRIVDNSGFRFFLTSQLHTFDVGVIELGLVYSPRNSIPPGQKKFSLSGYCDNRCTDLALPAQGITVFASQLHTHGTGWKVATYHLRNGRRLADLNRDDHYSPHYQEIRLLQKPVRVYQGDSLVTKCTYDTTRLSVVTFGGISHKDEMCLNYIFYYPKTDLELCKSEVSQPELDEFLQQMLKCKSIRCKCTLNPPSKSDFPILTIEHRLTKRNVEITLGVR
ncbi:hypothetical protein T265_00912 [Opisthorchis viverrini]|uniref:Copper type II ascorbate-dependent monooxygenase domain protein n=1 Tax=Opisthorchis viverrini TaxID=6198 RepID=A0A075ABN2_OPIVI|nr:hypothetical protein T265_00912 [Opisthorchis viverrini]KER33225.1 hypothetical protein T265_00912 [Opisthorchis viverrini]